MKFLFVVQGEGRGHMTQALTLASMLRSRGHELVGVLVGKSRLRQLPRFFSEGIGCELQMFTSPNFLASRKSGRAGIAATAVFNSRQLLQYRRSMLFLKHAIDESGADRVVNFFDVLTGLTYALYRPRVPQYCIGHQYVFLHHAHRLTGIDRLQLESLRFYTRLTALGAQECLALSFCPMDDDAEMRISVVPPLLRRAVLEAVPSRGDYIHGYMLNPGFALGLEQWHKEHPEVPLHFFWDKPGEPAHKQVDATLEYFTLDDRLFIEQLAGCLAYACTAGFESVCEAMYLGKPVMMVPAHVEQECNACDAVCHGAGIAARGFELDRLLGFALTYEPKGEFRTWVEQAEGRIVELLTRQSPYPTPSLLKTQVRLPRRVQHLRHLARQYYTRLQRSI